jgi:hypothetical protein
MVQTPPALIALGFFDTSRDRVNAWSPSRHPALRRALNATRTIHLPPATICLRSLVCDRRGRGDRRGAQRIMSASLRTSIALVALSIAALAAALHLGPVALTDIFAG